MNYPNSFLGNNFEIDYDITKKVDIRNLEAIRIICKYGKHYIMLSSFFNIEESTKICGKCKIDKSLSYFNKSGTGFQSICKDCNKKYYQENKESLKKSIRTYQKENKESITEYYREYQLANKGRYSARDAKRRASKLNATPFWSEFDLIVLLYDECKLISESTEIKHQVDHIIPLQSEFVCGLHVLANLQIISAKENQSKSNSFVVNQ